MTMTEKEKQKALEARRRYQRERYRKNRDKICEQQNAWRRDNPEKVKEYNMRYWLKRAEAAEQERIQDPKRKKGEI